MQIFKRKKIVQEVPAQQTFKPFIYRDKFTIRQLRKKRYMRQSDADFLYRLAEHINMYYTKADCITDDLKRIAKRIYKGVGK